VTPAQLLGESTTCKGKGAVWLSKKVLQAARKRLLIQGGGPWLFCISDDGKGAVLFFSRSRYRIGLARGLASRLRKVVVPLCVASVTQCLTGLVCPIWVSLLQGEHRQSAVSPVEGVWSTRCTERRARAEFVQPEQEMVKRRSYCRLQKCGGLLQRR